MRIIIFIIFIIVITVILNPPTLAQDIANCGGGTVARAQGLVTSSNLSGKFGSTGACITDSKVAFAPFKIPTYADLKSFYYNQSKLAKNSLPSDLKFSGDGIYANLSDLTISQTPTGSGSEVIFVNGALNINQNIVYHTTDGAGGLVFVIRDNVAIDSTVTQVDAVIIAQGTIYTAGSGCVTNSSNKDSQGADIKALVVNGSLISLNGDNYIHFCRKLLNNNNPAEIINTQFKYLVTLRDLMSDTLQRWSEIGATTLPSPLPISLPSPSPSPTPIPCSSGLLTDGCFESQLAKWGCGGAISGSCSADSTTKYSGSYAAQVVNTGGWWGWQLSQGNISASIGEQFCLSARVKKQSATDTISIAIQETGPATTWKEVDRYAQKNTDWQLISSTVQVGSNWSPPIQVFLRAWNTNNVAWFDDVSLTRGVCQ